MFECLLTAGAIAVCILLFAFSILIHEFGHFVAARALGLRVEAFSIGFGPAIWKWKVGSCEYRISWIPLGGYVSLPDLDPEGTKALEGGVSEAAPEEVPAWKRIVVAVAGPFGNVVLAVALAIALQFTPSAHFGVTPADISTVLEGSPAEAGGLKGGDSVLSVGGKAVSNWYDMLVEIQLSKGAPTKFVVRRGESDVELEISPSQHEVTGAWYIGALSIAMEEKAAYWMPERNWLKQLKWDASAIARLLKAFVTPKEAKAAAGAVSGPVGIAEGLYHQVRSRPSDAVGFMRYLNVNLAMLNLLPIPVLDGGIILFALIELLFRRKVSRKIVNALSTCFMYLLLALMLFLVGRDSWRSYKMHSVTVKADNGPVTSETVTNVTDVTETTGADVTEEAQ